MQRTSASCLTWYSSGTACSRADHLRTRRSERSSGARDPSGSQSASRSRAWSHPAPSSPHSQPWHRTRNDTPMKRRRTGAGAGQADEPPGAAGVLSMSRAQLVVQPATRLRLRPVGTRLHFIEGVDQSLAAFDTLLLLPVPHMRAVKGLLD